MNQITAQQVRSAIEVAGLAPQEEPEVIAAGLRSLLDAAQPAYDALAFDSEPSNFAVALGAHPS